MEHSPLEQQAAAVADGTGLDDAGSATLRTIDRISQAFRRTQRDKPCRDCLFRWRHLEAVELIGKGGFGEVYRAFDPLLKRDVALKLAHTGNSVDRDRLIVAEARRMARLRHPSILAIHGADLEDGRTGIWSDLLNGQTLEQMVDARGRLSAADMLTLFRPLADALVLIHDRHVTHGDFKPGNVMILESGEPVLMDFGAGADLRTVGPVAGSPIVMAPELFAGEPQSPATDVYAFGATMMFALTGRYPLECDTLEALAARHQQGGPVDVSDLPRPLRSLARRCLAAAPDTRPSSQEVLAALDGLIDAPRLRRRRMAISAVIASLALGLLLSSLGFLRAQRSADLANRERLRAETTLGFLQNMLAAPSPYNQGRQLTVERLLNLASSELSRQSPGRLEESQLRMILGQTYRSLHELERARAEILRALDLHRGDGPDERYLSLSLDLAQIDLEAGQLTTADQSLSGLEDLSSVTLGQDHPITLKARYLRAMVARRQGDQALQRRLLEEVLASGARAPAEDPLLSNAQLALAEIYRDSGMVPQAEQLASEALQWEIRQRGPDSYGTVAKRQMLATVHFRAGRYDEAARLSREAMATLEQFDLGVTAELITLNTTLSGALSYAGKVEEGLAGELESLRMIEDYEFATPSHRLSVIGNVGDRYAALGDFDKAVEYTTRAIELGRQNLGAEAPMTLLYEIELNGHLLAAGRTEALQQRAGQVYDDALENLGPRHILTLTAADYRAAALMHIGELEQARELLLGTRRVKQETIGADHPMTWDTVEILIRAELDLGTKRPDLHARARQLLEQRIDFYPPGHRKIEAARRLVALTTETG